MVQNRKEHTLQSALDHADHEANPVGAMRLIAWAVMREVEGPLPFEQGPGAAAALLSAKGRR